MRAQVLDRIEHGSYRVEKVVYWSRPETPVPGLLFLPKRPAAAPAVIYANEDGKTAGRAVELYLKPLVEAGHAVLAIDLSATGETSPGESPLSYRSYFDGPQAALFYRALRSGRSLAGIRVHDLLRGVDYLARRPEIDPKRISAYGFGAAGVITTYAGALDERIVGVVSVGALASYEAIAASELFAQSLGVFVPAVRRHFDLPDVAALIAPRPLALMNLVDGVNRRMEPEIVADAYRATAAVYRLLGAPQAFRLTHPYSAEEILLASREIFERR